MDHDYLAEFASVARHKLEEWQNNLAAAKDPIDQLPAEDMVRITEIIVNHVKAESSEDELRDGIAELRNAMASSLDAGASMTAQNVIDIIHDILGDEELDLGTVPRSIHDAVQFLAKTISRDAKRRLRTEIVEGRKDDLQLSLKLGMSVRNTLRSAGFTEAALGIANLDDVWFDLLERALLLQDAI